MKALQLALSLIVAGAAWAQPPARGQFGPRPNLETRLTRQLNLTAEQQNKVHTILAESRVQSQGAMQQMQTLNAALVNAIKSGDESQVDKATQDVASFQQQQSAIRAKSMAKIYAALTPDQKTKVGPNLEMLLGPRGRGMRRPPPPKQQ